MSSTPPAEPQSTIRVALLICDPTGTDTYGNFKQWLEGALPSSSPLSLEIESYKAYKGEYPTSEEVGTMFDVVIISGSPSDAFGNQVWIRELLVLVQHTYNKHRNVRLFGVCFGHQIISRALGGMVVQNSKFEYGLTRIDLTHVGKSIFGTKSDSFELQQIHQDHVPLDTLSDFFTPGDIYLLGSSPRTPNQGFVKFYKNCKRCDEGHSDHEIHEHIHIMTVQGHPEFSDAMCTNIFFDRARNGAIRDPAVSAYLGAAGPSQPEEHDSTSGDWLKRYDGNYVVGRAFWKMFGVKCDV